MRRRNFIFAGQSNNSGRGVLSEVPVYANAERMHLFGNDGVWKLAEEPFDSIVGQPATSPSREAGEAPGAGPALAFANHLCSLFPEDEVGLIPCAMGSSAINAWRRLPTKDNLYGSMIARAMEAGDIAGLIWWQGEAETADTTLAAGWREKFGNLVADIRVDLGLLDLPVAFVRLNQHNPKAFWNTVRNAQTGVYIRRAVMVDSDLPLSQYKADKVHCTTAGYQIMGVRMADAIAPLLTTP